MQAISLGYNVCKNSHAFSFAYNKCKNSLLDIKFAIFSAVDGFSRLISLLKIVVTS